VEKTKHIAIGEIYREHGIKGYCKVRPYQGGRDFFITDKHYELIAHHMQKKARLIDCKPMGEFCLIKFDCFSTPEEIKPWRKAQVMIARSEMPVTQGVIHDFEWSGMHLCNAQKIEIGIVQKVIYTPLKQLLVDAQGQEVLIPFVANWIIEFNRMAKTVVMDLPEGLIQ